MRHSVVLTFSLGHHNTTKYSQNSCTDPKTFFWMAYVFNYAVVIIYSFYQSRTAVWICSWRDCELIGSLNGLLFQFHTGLCLYFLAVVMYRIWEHKEKSRREKTECKCHDDPLCIFSTNATAYQLNGPFVMVNFQH